MSQKAAKRARREARETLASLARSQPDLIGQLRDHIVFIRTSAAAYDAGAENEAKRIAVSVRVLVHDTPQSHSILSQLGLKDTMRFYDTANRVDRRNPFTQMGLFSLRVHVDGEAQRASYVPRLDDLPPNAKRGWIPFEGWWSGPVSRLPPEDLDVSRADYILTVANTEGGAHVDRSLSPIYSALSSQNGFRWNLGRTRDGVDENLGAPDTDPLFAAVRQIGHELIASLDHHIPTLLSKAA